MMNISCKNYVRFMCGNEFGLFAAKVISVRSRCRVTSIESAWSLRSLPGNVVYSRSSLLFILIALENEILKLNIHSEERSTGGVKSAPLLSGQSSFSSCPSSLSSRTHFIHLNNVVFTSLPCRLVPERTKCTKVHRKISYLLWW